MPFRQVPRQLNFALKRRTDAYRAPPFVSCADILTVASMNQAVTAESFSTEQFEAFLATRKEPDWLIEQRREAWRVFQEQQMPTRTEEEWIRTDIRLFKWADHDWTTTPPVGDQQASKPWLAENVELGGETSSINGHSTRSQLQDSLAARGVIFGSLDAMVAEHPDLVRKYLLNRAVNPHFDKFSALHAAGWGSGTFLYVPRNVRIEEPLHAHATLTNGGVDMSHTLVVLEEGAEASLLVETGSTTADGSGLHCGATELILGPRARLRYVGLQDWAQGVWHFAHQKAIVSRDASLQWTIGALGSRLAKVNQHVELAGLGAECQVNGVMFTEGKQHLSYHTLQHHTAPSCRSDFLYKAALQDRSRTVWRGMIKVDKNAQKTDGYQRNDNLLLSGNARADAIPGLEIEADDVRCTHGSTTGKVDEELIFYARCRGFTRKEAVQMIVTGFFQQIFDRITIKSVRDALSLAIARRVREYE